MTDDSQDVLKRIMPHSEKGERSILGTVFADQNSPAVALEHCSVAGFYSKQYGIVFSCMVELFNEGRPVDILTVQGKLKTKDVPPEMQGLDSLREIAQNETTAANIWEYVKTTHVKAVERKLIQASEGIANSCYADSQELETLLREIEEKIFRILQQWSAAEFTPISEITPRVPERVQEAHQNGAEVTGTPTGFINLDRRLGGLQPSSLVLIAACPSMGKTAFVPNIVKHAAVRNDRSCMIFSLGMSKEQLVNRILSMELSVDAWKMRNDDLSSGDFGNIIEAAVHTSESKNLVVDDTAGIGIGELRSKCRKQKLEHEVGLVIIDYLQFMSGSGKSDENRQQEISDISRNLEALVRELQAPVIALSQLSCAMEQRPDHRPMFSDLRGSDVIRQDVDVVMLLYRGDYYNKDTEHPNEVEVIIAKQRNDPIGTVSLVWEPDTTRFVNMTR